jgi:hypothetical protein
MIPNASLIIPNASLMIQNASPMIQNASRMKSILTCFAILFVFINTSCARKIDSAGQTELKTPLNPYTKKEYEKAKEANPNIPLEKQ